MFAPEYELVPTEFLLRKAEGDETRSYFEKYPLRDTNTSLEIVRIRAGESYTLVSETDYLVVPKKGFVEYLFEIEEGDRILVKNYAYDPLYYKYLNALRMQVGDADLESPRYNYDYLLEEFHNAIALKLMPIAKWPYTFNKDYARYEEEISDARLNIICGFAALGIFRGEVKKSLRNAVMISDVSSKIDTTKNLNQQLASLEKDEIELNIQLRNFIITGEYSYSQDSVRSVDGAST